MEGIAVQRSRVDPQQASSGVGVGGGDPGAAVHRTGGPDLLHHPVELRGRRIRPEEAPEAMALLHELRRLLARAVADLPEAEQLLVVRHGLGDEPLGEVAAGLGLGAERGRLLYRRALLRLRRRLRALA